MRICQICHKIRFKLIYAFSLPYPNGTVIKRTGACKTCLIEMGRKVMQKEFSEQNEQLNMAG